MAWRRENLRYRLTSARSIEETGLDSFTCGDAFPYYSTNALVPARQGGWITGPKNKVYSLTSPHVYSPKNTDFQDDHAVYEECSIPAHEAHRHSEITGLSKHDNHHKDLLSNKREYSVRQRGIGQSTNQNEQTKRISKRSKDIGSSNSVAQARIGQAGIISISSNNIKEDVFHPHAARLAKENKIPSNSSFLNKRKMKEVHNETTRNTDGALLKQNETMKGNFMNHRDDALQSDVQKQHISMEKTELQSELQYPSLGTNIENFSVSHAETIIEHSDRDFQMPILPSGLAESDYRGEVATCQTDARSELSSSNNYIDSVGDSGSADDTETLFPGEELTRAPCGEDTPTSQTSIPDVQKRWRRLKNKVTVINRMTAAANKSSNYDLLNEEAIQGIQKSTMYVKGDAGSMGAAAFEGVKTTTKRCRGRKGMEGLLVRQDKGLFTFIQDFYVTCLKLPIVYFLIGVFLIPVALGLVFTPLYLVDVNGLSFDGVMDESSSGGLIASMKRNSILNIFLYALSLSTTFGGSPVVAVSPYCLLVANMHTLLAQFLFVFLSGAVFARMSQPSHPIRCARKAILKIDDVANNTEEEDEEKLRVLAIRLVLGGPTPCELVDAKICLTFRIFVALPNGSTFCSTQDLDLVRSEVSYLRYGLMVRHVIDKKSPLYGHTMESLDEGDASFSLTIMGLERSSMQQIFHLEDYFVSDGDVAWDGEYEDFIHVNEKGQRVLDHSKIDLLKSRRVNSQSY